MIQFLKLLFHVSVIFLIMISLSPGSLIGYLLYGDWAREPILIENRFGTAINHFIYYAYVSLLGFFLHLKTKNFNKLVMVMFFLCIILEILHFVIPNRSFQIVDLFANIFGVTVAYCAVRIYLFLGRS